MKKKKTGFWKWTSSWQQHKPFFFWAPSLLLPPPSPPSLYPSPFPLLLSLPHTLTLLRLIETILQEVNSSSLQLRCIHECWCIKSEHWLFTPWKTKALFIKVPAPQKNHSTFCEAALHHTSNQFSYWKGSNRVKRTTEKAESLSDVVSPLLCGSAVGVAASYGNCGFAEVVVVIAPV